MTVGFGSWGRRQREGRPARSRGLKIPPLRLRLFGFVLLACVGVGCPCVRGAVNASPGLRWWLFSNFGASHMCPEMLKRGAGLRLSPTGNIIGRFFPSACHTDVNDDRHTVTLNLQGTGFAWTPLAGRIGFSCAVSVEYRPDFYMASDATYVWAKMNRIVYGPDFKITSIENKTFDWAQRTPIGYITNMFAGQVVSTQVGMGFTVVHGDQGDDFTLGILQPPAKPRHPFNLKDGDHYVFANETTEVHYGEVDFLGPFEVTDKKQALFLRFRLQGPAVDALLLPRVTGDIWRDALEKGAQLAPPRAPPITAFVVTPGPDLKRKFPLPPGEYYVVIDNSNQVGTVSPPWSPTAAIGGDAAVVSYTAEVGDASDEF
jgi:hypothetical protein